MCCENNLEVNLRSVFSHRFFPKDGKTLNRTFILEYYSGIIGYAMRGIRVWKLQLKFQTF